jgi:hypothetical protein
MVSCCGAKRGRSLGKSWSTVENSLKMEKIRKELISKKKAGVCFLYTHLSYLVDVRSKWRNSAQCFLPAYVPRSLTNDLKVQLRESLGRKAISRSISRIVKNLTSEPLQA